MTTGLDSVRSKSSELMPGLIDDLKSMVGHASVAFPGFPSEPVDAMRAAVVDLLRRSGVEDVRELDLGAGHPSVFGTVPGPKDAPTVLLYAHYDVQPAPKEQGWDTEPFVATVGDDGRIYGRGAADDKSGIIIHAGALQVFGGNPPVNVKVLIEGEEETVSHLGPYVRSHPEMFQADVFVIADMGNMRAGEPALTTTLRGNAVCDVTVRSLDHPAHSGIFGGAAPDALLAMIKLLSRLHDDDGALAVPGLHGYEWTGAEPDESDFVEASGMVDGAELIGSGTLGSRLWSKPAASVIGIDAPSVDKASNVVLPEARARISMRVAPGGNADTELDKLMAFLKEQAPWGVEVDVERVRTSFPFAADLEGPAAKAATEAFGEAYGQTVGLIGSGGSIGLVSTLSEVSPDAEVLLFGAEDVAKAKIHASNESVDPAEIEHLVVAEAMLMEKLASR
jgi:acetylornithine deacetylase/succinyl-diaminopimelate desuccinylase-like protein